MKKLRVAILGQGRSGRDIHGRYFQSDIAKEKYEVAVIVEPREERRVRAAEEFGCEILSDYKQLFGRTDIDLVINSTTSEQHHPVTVDLLNHGFNVVCEKPASHTVAELDEMIEAAKKNGKYMNIFQQSRFAPFFLKIKEVINSGVLGDIIDITVEYGGFSRRWDWQTILCYNAGNLYNTAPHPMDQVLALLNAYDEKPTVLSRLYNANTFGDAEDFAKVVISIPGKPFATVMATCSDAYMTDTYKIQGTRGTLVSTQAIVKWKYFKESEAPEQKLQATPIVRADGTPAYCSEQLTWYEEECNVNASGSFTTAVHSYYNMTYDALVNGADTEIKPEQVRQQIAIYEEVRRQNPHIAKKYELSDFAK